MSNWRLKFNTALNKIIFTVDKYVYHNTLSRKLPTMPYLYGLPKIHKAEKTMRPIVASLRSPSQNSSLWLSKILSPLVGIESQEHLKHSSDLLESKQH